VDSPDNKYRAYAFVVDGGATTDWMPQVSLKKKSFFTFRPLKTNVFRCAGSREIDVKWESSDTLKVITGCNPDPSAQRILMQKFDCDGVKIRYQYLKQ